MSTVNTAKRKAVRPPPKEVTGISEPYHRTAAVVVNSTTFSSIVLDEAKDVMVLFHASICESCSHLAPFFRKMAERFHDLAIPSLVIARMDVSSDFPPVELDIQLKSLPTIIFFPADAKTQPYRYHAKPSPPVDWTGIVARALVGLGVRSILTPRVCCLCLPRLCRYYSGLGKTLPMMLWVQEEAAIRFTLPDLPHLSESDRVLYKEQVRPPALFQDWLARVETGHQHHCLYAMHRCMNVRYRGEEKVSNSMGNGLAGGLVVENFYDLGANRIQPGSSVSTSKDWF